MLTAIVSPVRLRIKGAPSDPEILDLGQSEGERDGSFWTDALRTV